MLEDFKENSFYLYAKNVKKYFHAYLFEVDDIEANYPLVLAFAKNILCKHHYMDSKRCNDCNICSIIDKGYYEDLKVIEPISSVIKKEQILELKKKFSLKSSNDNNRVYIMKYAECMNASASNSLLKFIEEPESGIYGILITMNRKQILPTILSRCVFISLKGKQKEELELSLITNLCSFLKNVIQKNVEELPYLKKDFFFYYENREQILKAFHYMELILDSSIGQFYQKEVKYSKEICDIIEKSLGEISIENQIFLLDKVVKYRNKLINVINVNLNLFMDRFIIEISEVVK